MLCALCCACDARTPPQDVDFVDRGAFALLGFQRLGNPLYHNNLRNPYARSHVYKCCMLNLSRLKGIDYDCAVWAMEDIDFNKRLVCDCFPRPAHGPEGKLCFRAASTPPRACACWSGDASRQPEILCKIRRFGFYQRKLPGGASGTSDRKPQPPKPGPPKKGLPPPGPRARQLCKQRA
ncbi:hypothetical protein EMIHUDRAFT_228632 [Emiliania huxleyi CCMP1516]|uniref:Uncharacterized protein n=2 Tax=Emiliania huxleyi TaxID=2903 RepID=A0A0D3KFC0_EMIH1|nr:hypothetical protein EMIHUDRAFT_228632 [Emiliania huxleyi CCMP1516]EOD34455.1 hypothetical protein EMIHUDRAFT_228632 [Emiliania huxleyi CCMP1516]|eukprot:XP_005786884.1 hypothetical protein EMIHUDRAFT_228632 [Emiliania huxleyi CCMP1516]